MDARLSWRTLPTLKRLLPFQQFVGEPQVWLNNDVKPPRPDKAVCSGEREIHGLHNLGDADRCTP